MSLPETQSQRRIKYGGNVVLSCVVVVLLAGLGVYLAQRSPRRIDTTLSGVNSLTPQTVAILRGVPGKVRLVSLYPRSASQNAADKEEQDYYQPVADLLEEYARRSPNVTVDLIDPTNEPGKLDSLINEVTEKYGQEIKPYKEFLDAFPKFVGEFRAISDGQAKAFEAIAPAVNSVEDQELAQTLQVAQATVTGLSQRLTAAKDGIERRLSGKIPDYRNAVADCQRALEDLDLLIGKVTDDFKALPPPPRTPAAVAEYARVNLPAFESAGQLVKRQLERARGLGELKLDTLRRSIQRQTILVMGETEMRVLGFGDVWQPADDLRSIATAARTEKPRLKFAGEQQVSTALLSVSRPTKPLVVFVRSAGPPLTQSFPGMRPAQMSMLARRLRAANFEVVEKDLSGQFAMQAMRMGMPIAEASEEQMRDRGAVWVATSLIPAMSEMGPDPLPGKLSEHLTEGGSAVVLVDPEVNDLEPALRGFGVTARTDAMIVKEPVPPPPGSDGMDLIAQVSRAPYIFLTREYGEHALTRPVGALEALLITPTPVSYTETAGYRYTPLLPATQVVRTWGETDVQSVLGETPPTFDAAKDIANVAGAPLYSGVAVEAVGGASTQPSNQARLVVLGSVRSFSNTVMSLPDEDLLRQGISTPRFPGNAELMVNAVFWTARMDTMLEISPAAMEVSRIRPIPAGTLSFLRWGVIVAALPLTVSLAGMFVYLRRRR